MMKICLLCGSPIMTTRTRRDLADTAPQHFMCFVCWALDDGDEIPDLIPEALMLIDRAHPGSWITH